jgi:hypothetical protein
MCVNESVGTAIGLGLNISPIIFSFFTIVCVVQGGLSFKNAIDAEELIEKAVGARGPV